MATKTTIQNLINSNLASGSNITASEHRAVLNSILNEIYPTAIRENNATVTKVITAPNLINTDLQYDCYFIKQGNVVHVKGLLKNLGNEIVSGGYFFEIVSPEFLPDPDVNFTLIPVDGGGVVSFTDNKIQISIIAQLQEVSFDLTYITQ